MTHCAILMKSLFARKQSDVLFPLQDFANCVRDYTDWVLQGIKSQTFILISNHVKFYEEPMPRTTGEENRIMYENLEMNSLHSFTDFL